MIDGQIVKMPCISRGFHHLETQGKTKLMVPGDGLEPSTSGSTIQRSNQLSYPGLGRMAAYPRDPSDTEDGMGGKC